LNSYVFGQLGLWGVFILFGAMQGLALGVHFLFRNRGDTVTNRWLALVILLISVHMGETMLTETALVEYAPWAMGSSWFLVFMLGPAYYFYVRRVVRPDLAFGWSDLLHFLPAVVIFVDMMPWLTAPAEMKIEWQRHLASGGAMNLRPRTIVKMAFHVVQNFAYLMACFGLVNHAEARLAERSSDNDLDANLRALRSVIRWFAGWSAVYLFLFLALVFLGTYGAKVDKVWMIVISIFVQANGLVALNRPEVFFGILGPESEADDREPDVLIEPVPVPELKYRNSSLSEEQLNHYRTVFEDLMTTTKPYRDGTLRLADLADRLDISTHHLSQMLNRELGGNFFEVINSYRVAEAKRLMAAQEYDNQTLLALAFAAGFNNKNSFNRAFKKEVGQTPSVFWKNQRQAG